MFIQNFCRKEYILSQKIMIDRDRKCNHVNSRAIYFLLFTRLDGYIIGLYNLVI